MSYGSVYQLIGSKEALFYSIMQPFYATLTESYKLIVGSTSTVVEKLDALTWFSINFMSRYHEESQIHRGWLRLPPGSGRNLDGYQRTQGRQLKALLREGVQSDEIKMAAPSLAILTMAIGDLMWVPATVVVVAGSDRRIVLQHTRVALFHGIATG